MSKVGSAVIYLKQTAITAVIPLLSLVFLTHYISVEEFGQFALVQAYVVVITGVASLGIHVGYEREFFRFSKSKVRLALFHRSVVTFSCFVYFAFFILSNFLINYVSEYISVSFYVIAFYLIGGFLDKIAQFFLLYLRNGERASLYAKAIILNVFLSNVLSVMLVALFGQGVNGLAFAYLMSWFVVLLYLIRVTNYRFSRFISRKMIADIVRLSLPAVPRSLTAVFANQSDKYMLNVLNTIGGVGVYSIAVRVSTVLNSYMLALQNAYTPFLFNSMFSEETKRLDGFLFLICYLSIAPALLMALLSPELVIIFLPDEYVEVGQMLVAFSFYYAVLFFGKVTSKQLIFAKKIGLTSFYSIVFSIANVLLNIPMILYYGALGAVYATLMVGVVYTCLNFFLAQKFSPLPWPYLSCGLVLVPVFMASVLEILVGSGLLAERIYIYAFKITILLLFFYVGYRAGVFSKENISRFICDLRVAK